MLIRCTVMPLLRLFSEILIVTWGLKCEDSQVTSKAGRLIRKSLNFILLELRLLDAVTFTVTCHPLMFFSE